MGIVHCKKTDASVDTNNPFPSCVPTVWRRASATAATAETPGKTIDTVKSVEGGWRRNTSNGVRKPEDSVDKRGTLEAEVIIRMQKQIRLTVFLPRLIAAYCLNSSYGDVGLNASHLTVYRSLLYSLSSYYPDVVLIDFSKKQLVPMRRMSLQAGISPVFPSLLPEGTQLEKYSFVGETGGREDDTSWLVALILSLGREQTVNRAAATSLNPSKQFLYKILSALVPHSIILPHPFTTFMPSSPSKGIALQSLEQIPAHQSPKCDSPNFTSPSNSSPSCGYSSSQAVDYMDADSFLSGFKCPLGFVVSMAVKACSDPDHLVRVPAVSFLGLLSPEQWKALSVTCSVTSSIHVTNSYVSSLCPEKVPSDHSSIDTQQRLSYHGGNTAHVHVTSVISSLLQACGDSMGTVRVAGFKAFGDGTLNGALSLSPLFTPVLTSEEMNRGGDWRMPVGDSGHGELSLDNMLTCLRKGCIDTKLAVSLL